MSVCLYVCLCVWMYVCMLACMHVCMYVCTYNKYWRRRFLDPERPCRREKTKRRQGEGPLPQHELWRGPMHSDSRLRVRDKIGQDELLHPQKRRYTPQKGAGARFIWHLYTCIHIHTFIIQPSKFCKVARFICTRGFQKSNRQILLGCSFCTRGGSLGLCPNDPPLVQNE